MRTNRHFKANICFWQFCERVYKVDQLARCKRVRIVLDRIQNRLWLLVMFQPQKIGPRTTGTQQYVSSCTLDFALRLRDWLVQRFVLILKLLGSCHHILSTFYVTSVHKILPRGSSVASGHPSCWSRSSGSSLSS